MQSTLALATSNTSGIHPTNCEYEKLVDIRNVKLRDGATRFENALYFLEQIKNPHMFRVGDDVVETCCIGDESLSDVLVRHFSRRA